MHLWIWDVIKKGRILTSIQFLILRASMQWLRKQLSRYLLFTPLLMTNFVKQPLGLPGLLIG